jgi:hypothetical protein
MKKLKIATTSFIFSDTRIKNIKILKNYIDHIELLYFEGKKHHDLPTLKELNYFKNTTISYSVHLPTNTTDFYKIEKFISNFNLIENIRYLIIHSEYNIKGLMKIYNLQKKYLKEIIVENTSINLHHIKNFIHNKINICFDIGHTFPHYDAYSIINFLNIHHQYIKYLHVYGTLDGKKHQSLIYLNNDLLNFLIKFAIKNNITFCIEVFTLKDLIESLNMLMKHHNHMLF